MVLFANGAFAATINIDFNEANLDVTESVLGDPDQTHITSIRSKGFELEYVPFGNGSFLMSGGPDVAAAWGPDGTIEMSALDGRLFDLASVDLSSWYDTTLTVTGYYAAGGTVTTSFFNIGSVFLTTVNFDSSWTGLEKVAFDSAGSPGIIDNITVQAVPIPAAVWLFGSALAGLGWMRRRQS